jgi:hypothetical protein
MSSIKLKHSGGNSVSLNPPTSAPTSSEVAFKLPNADGSAGQVIKTDGSGALSFVAQSVAGITELDSWRITSNFSNYANNDITANWERNDNQFEKIGTGLTESSGVFSFPSTGKYVILYNGQATGNGDRYIGIVGYVSSNGGSSYTQLSEAYGSAYNSGAVTYANFSLVDSVDVTDISQFKIKFLASSSGTCTYSGDTHSNRNGFIAFKVGET